MADNSAIEWCDATWNPTVGCSVVSPGCTNCYAMRAAHRFGGSMPWSPAGKNAKYAGLTKEVNFNPVWTGKARLDEAALTKPLSWKKRRRIFVNSMSDLFHENLPDEAIDEVMSVIGACEDQDLGHQFLILTKRAQRQRDYMNSKRAYRAWNSRRLDREAWPPRNIWAGVSVEDQQRADERIPLLLDTPAAKRFISAEPLLGPVDLKRVGFIAKGNGSVRQEFWIDALRGATTTWEPARAGGWGGVTRGKLDWVIAGGESGRGARPMHPDWARSLRDQCTAAGVAYFFKQWGAWLPGENLGWPLARWQDGAEGKHPSVREDRDNPEWRHFGTPGELGAFALRVGKAKAGRLLDGRTWDEFPA